MFSTFLLTGCGRGGKQEVIVSLNQQEVHPEYTGMTAFKNYIESRLGESFEIKIYPNGTLGANEKVLEQIKQGTVHFLVVSAANLEPIDRVYALFSIPYVFTNEAVYEKFITDPEFVKKLIANSTNTSFTPLVAFTSGTRNFYARTPIYSVADLVGKRFRVQASPVNVAMMQAFGATAVPMTFSEVYTTLQRGIIDGAENNELALTLNKHGEVAPYYAYNMHQMCPDMFIGSNKFLDSLTPSQRQVFEEAAKEAQRVEFDAWHKQIEEAKAQAKAMGVKFIQVDIKEFRNKVLPLHEQFLGDNPAIRSLYEEAVVANGL